MARSTSTALRSAPASSASASRACGSSGSTSSCCSATLGLIVFSLVTLDSATAAATAVTSLLRRRGRAIYAVVGLVLMIVLASIDYSRFRELRTGLYVAMMGLILLVLALGGATRGSRRWIELPFFRFQPSELGKVLLVLAPLGVRARPAAVRERQADDVENHAPGARADSCW